MNMPRDESGVQAVVDFWTGMIPQFFGQLGVHLPGTSNTSGASNASAYDWLAQWNSAMPGAVGKIDGASAASAMQAMLAPWTSLWTPPAATRAPSDAASSPAASSAGTMTGMLNPWAAALPFMPAAQAGDASSAMAAAMQPMQAAQQAWLDFMSRVSTASPQTLLIGFDRTFGGLFDALGFGPMRKLQAGLQDLAAASLAQNQARGAYAMLVQGAFASGLERLMLQLSKMADAGERVDSVLALLKMWAVNTEQAVHEVLQSEGGLEATAALARAGVAHRRKLQHAAGIVADSLDMATRRELDEVYRELHELKREMRALRSASPKPVTPPVAKSRSGATKRSSKR
jgi:poly(hydroxyalkanoate) synthase III subunit E